MNRFWKYYDKICTSDELKRAGVSRLRCINLGRCETVAEARARAAKAPYDPALVPAKNIRIVCDSGRGGMFGITADQIARLRAGETIDLEDAQGRMVLGYSRIDEGE